MTRTIRSLQIAFIALLLCNLFSFKATGATEKREYSGEIITFTIDNSQIYPGTTREIAVYVPKVYTGMYPACLLVRMDGLSSSIYSDIDKLIAQKKMPVTIAVGVKPGRIYSNGTATRYNRSNEFDRTDGKFATFLEKEVLPRVEKLTTSDGRRVIISSSTCDRAITGVSSGAIAAFAAAWNRPDMFSRIYSVIGTYMPFRGGDQFPGIIRKTEPKALRIYIQDNDNDSWNPLFGSWFEENQRMYNALKFAGYDVVCQWNKGGHDGSNGLKQFCKAMEWLWRDYPKSVEKGETENSAIKSIVIPGEEWKGISEMVYGEVAQMMVTESMSSAAKGKVEEKQLSTAIYPGGSMRATLKKEGDRWISHWTLGSNGEYTNCQEFYALHAGAYGPMVYDCKGYLYVATEIGIEICDHNGRVRGILSYPARQFYGSTVSRCNKIYFKGDELYIEFEGTLFHRKLKVSGFEDAYSVPTPAKENEG